MRRRRGRRGRAARARSARPTVARLPRRAAISLRLPFRFVDPPNWKTNLGYAFGVLVFSGVCMFRISIKMEERPVAPKHNIPAQKWANVPPTDRDHW